MKHTLLALACSALIWHVATPTYALNPAATLAATTLQQANEDAVPRLQKARLTNVAFGNVPTIEVKIGEDTKTFLVSSGTGFNLSGQNKNLTGVAQTCIGEEVFLLTKRTDAGVQVERIWDYTSWLAYTTKHKGAQVGTVKHFNGRFLAIGDLTYLVNEGTQFVKGGESVGRKQLEGVTPLWVSGDVKDGMPVALIISDGPGGVNAQTSTGGAGNDRPESRGSSVRPPSTGTGNPAGAGSNPNGSPTERGNKERPASTGSGSKSPTERGNERPPSRGDGKQSPTEKATTLQRGLMVQIYFTILDPSDMITNAGAPGTVANAAAEKVGVDDNRVEVFGVLRLNGEKLWEIDRKETVKKGKNERLDVIPGKVNHFVLHTEKLKLKGNLKDDDNFSNADLLAEIDLEIDIYGQMSQGWKEFKLPGNKVKMHVVVAPMPEKK
ncbi:MAG: hypothetical protein LCH41_11070 [Armatimonadetes bacterium]|nr:hypothetical protein [Armatimonadota bacterium]